MDRKLAKTLAWLASLLALAVTTTLLFDESDSLFGKRSEVRDGHDRYDDQG